jgi:hypothetical protein
MSIRVKGYDFFSKSCYICEPISHIIQLRAPQCYIFRRKASGLLLITTVSSSLEGCAAPIAFCGSRGSYSSGYRTIAGFQGAETTVIDRSIDNDDASEWSIYSFPAPIEPISACGISRGPTGAIVGSIGAWKELKRLQNDGHSQTEVCLSVMCFHYAPWIPFGYAADTQPIRLIPQSTRFHPFDVFALDTQPIRNRYA